MRFLERRSRGGIDLDLPRPPSGAAPNAFLPSIALVPLRQHDGAPARCLVRPGEYLREGMAIGKAEGRGQCAVHSPIPGLVREIREIRLADGGRCQAVLIVLEGSFDRLGKRQERYLWRSLQRHDLVAGLREAGVVETDSPGRPLHEALKEAEGAELVVLNALECEPWLAAERTALVDRATEVLDGLAIALSVTGAKEAVAVLDATEPAARHALEKALAARDKDERPLRIVATAPRYPKDLPALLAETLGLARKGQTPAKAYFLRPTSALAAAEALAYGKPMLERYVSVGGAAVKHPGVLKVRIGTSIGDVLEERGGLVGVPERFVIGGALRGQPAYDLDSPVTKTTSAVLALSAEEVRKGREAPCVRCGSCVRGCPEGLDPDLLFRLVVRNRLEEARASGLGRCCGCGICSYLCPSRLPLAEGFIARNLRPSEEAPRAR